VVVPPASRRIVGDTVLLHGPRSDGRAKGGTRLVEVVVNGRAVASAHVLADGAVHELEFTVPITQSSWVALRHFPQMHTNPVNVIVAGKPVRASAESARWCAATIEQLWRARGPTIAAPDRDEAHQSFQNALAAYRRIAAEADD
jgi:hypothetical protein